MKTKNKILLLVIALFGICLSLFTTIQKQTSSTNDATQEVYALDDYEVRPKKDGVEKDYGIDLRYQYSDLEKTRNPNYPPSDGWLYDPDVPFEWKWFYNGGTLTIEGSTVNIQPRTLVLNGAYLRGVCGVALPSNSTIYTVDETVSRIYALDGITESAYRRAYFDHNKYKYSGVAIACTGNISFDGKGSIAVMGSFTAGVQPNGATHFYKQNYMFRDYSYTRDLVAETLMEYIKESNNILHNTNYVISEKDNNGKYIKTRIIDENGNNVNGYNETGVSGLDALFLDESHLHLNQELNYEWEENYNTVHRIGAYYLSYLPDYSLYFSVADSKLHKGAVDGPVYDGNYDGWSGSGKTLTLKKNFYFKTTASVGIYMNPTNASGVALYLGKNVRSTAQSYAATFRNSDGFFIKTNMLHQDSAPSTSKGLVGDYRLEGLNVLEVNVGKGVAEPIDYPNNIYKSAMIFTDNPGGTGTYGEYTRKEQDDNLSFANKKCYLMPTTMPLVFNRPNGILYFKDSDYQLRFYTQKAYTCDPFFGTGGHKVLQLEDFDYYTDSDEAAIIMPDGTSINNFYDCEKCKIVNYSTNKNSYVIKGLGSLTIEARMWESSDEAFQIISTHGNGITATDLTFTTDSFYKNSPVVIKANHHCIEFTNSLTLGGSAHLKCMAYDSSPESDSAYIYSANGTVTFSSNQVTLGTSAGNKTAYGIITKKFAVTGGNLSVYSKSTALSATSGGVEFSLTGGNLDLYTTDVQPLGAFKDNTWTQDDSGIVKYGVSSSNLTFSGPRAKTGAGAYTKTYSDLTNSSYRFVSFGQIPDYSLYFDAIHGMLLKNTDNWDDYVNNKDHTARTTEQKLADIEYTEGKGVTWWVEEFSNWHGDGPKYILHLNNFEFTTTANVVLYVDFEWTWNAWGEIDFSDMDGMQYYAGLLLEPGTTNVLTSLYTGNDNSFVLGNSSYYAYAYNPTNNVHGSAIGIAAGEGATLTLNGNSSASVFSNGTKFLRINNFYSYTQGTIVSSFSRNSTAYYPVAICDTSDQELTVINASTSEVTNLPTESTVVIRQASGGGGGGSANATIYYRTNCLADPEYIQMGIYGYVLDENENLSAPNYASVAVGDKLTVASPTQSMLNNGVYKFICWNTKADGSGISLNPGDKINPKAISEGCLYAIWELSISNNDYDQCTTQYFNPINFPSSSNYNLTRTYYADASAFEGRSTSTVTTTFEWLKNDGSGNYTITAVNDKIFLTGTNASDYKVNKDLINNPTSDVSVADNGEYVLKVTYYSLDAVKINDYHNYPVLKETLVYYSDPITINFANISYSAGTGTGDAPSSAVVRVGKATTLAAVGNLSKSGAYLIGWEDAIGTIYDFGSSVSLESSVTLTAKYQDKAQVELDTPVEYKAYTGSGVVYDVGFKTIEFTQADFTVEYSVAGANSWSTDLPTTVGTYDVRISKSFGTSHEKYIDTSKTVNNALIIGNGHTITYDLDLGADQYAFSDSSYASVTSLDTDTVIEGQTVSPSFDILCKYNGNSYANASFRLYFKEWQVVGNESTTYKPGQTLSLTTDITLKAVYEFKLEPEQEPIYRDDSSVGLKTATSYQWEYCATEVGTYTEIGPQSGGDTYELGNVSNEGWYKCKVTVGSYYAYTIPVHSSSVTFDPNGGTGTTYTWYGLKGYVIALPDYSPVFTMANKGFSEYNTASDGSGTSYGIGSEEGYVFGYNTTETLYPVWVTMSTPTIDETVQAYTVGSQNIAFKLQGTTTITGHWTIEYYVNGSWVSTAPTAVGTYDVKATHPKVGSYFAVNKTITGGLKIGTTITYNIHGATGFTQDSTVYYVGDNITVKDCSALVKTGYSYVKIQANGVDVTTATVPMVSGLAFDVIFEIADASIAITKTNDYTITLPNGMSGKESATYQWKYCATENGTYTDIAGATTSKLGTPANEGYYKCTVTCDGYTKDTVKVATHRLTFDGNTATSGSMNFIFNFEGRTVALTQNAFTKTGAKFSKWNTEDDGTGTDYADKANYTFGSADDTLYVKWVDKDTISFDTTQCKTYVNTPAAGYVNSANIAITNVSYKYRVNGSADPFSSTIPTAVGEYDVEVIRAEDATYKAFDEIILKGLKIGYKVSYDLNGGSGTISDSEAYLSGDSCTITLTSPTKDGYSFSHWSLGGTKVTTASISITESVTLKAIYTISLDAEPSTSNDFEVKLNANMPNKNTVTFKWYYTATSGTDGEAVSGETNAKMGTPTKHGFYYCIVSDADGITHKTVEIATHLTSFDGNTNDGGTAPTAIFNFEGRSSTLPTSTFTKTNKKCGGWVESTTNQSADYQDLGSYTFGSSDDTIYVFWVNKTAISINEAGISTIDLGATTGYVIQGTDAALSGFVVKYYVGSTWVSTIPAHAGTYNVQISRAEDATYMSYEVEITNGLVINKKVVTATISGQVLEYNGTNQVGNVTCYISGANGNPIYLTATTAPGEMKDVGSGYNFTFAIPNAYISDYEFQSASTTISFTCEIVKGYTVINTSGVQTDLTYTAEELVVSGATINHSEASIVYSCDKQIFDKGTYTVKISVPDTLNYYGAETTLTITVKYPSVKTDPIVTGLPTETLVFTYGDDVKAPEIKVEKGTYTCDFVGGVIDAGTYTATYFIPETILCKEATYKVTIIVNKKVIDAPSVNVENYIENGTTHAPSVSGVSEFVTVSGTTSESKAGVYTITFTCDKNHTFASGNSLSTIWEIKRASINQDSDPSNPSEKPSVIIESNFGFGEDIELIVEVVVQSDVLDSVEKKETIVDYYNITDEIAKLTKKEEVGIVFDVKLVRYVNGQRIEIQPSDIHEGMNIKVKMLLPADLDIDRVTRLLHVHAADDIEVFEFDPSLIDEDGYYSITINRLSEFAFIYEKQNNGLWILFVLLAIILIIVGIYFVWKYEYEHVSDDKFDQRRLKKLDKICLVIYKRFHNERAVESKVEEQKVEVLEEPKPEVIEEPKEENKSEE